MKNEKIHISLAIDSETNTSFDIESERDIDEICENLILKYQIGESLGNKLKKYIETYIETEKLKEIEKEKIKAQKIHDSLDRLYYKFVKENKVKEEVKNKIRNDKLKENIKECSFQPKTLYKNNFKREDKKIEEKLMNDGKKSQEKKQIKRIINNLEERKSMDKLKIKQKLNNHSKNSSVLNDEITHQAQLLTSYKKKGISPIESIKANEPKNVKEKNLKSSENNNQIFKFEDVVFSGEKQLFENKFQGALTERKGSVKHDLNQSEYLKINLRNSFTKKDINEKDSLSDLKGLSPNLNPKSLATSKTHSKENLLKNFEQQRFIQPNSKQSTTSLNQVQLNTTNLLNPKNGSISNHNGNSTKSYKEKFLKSINKDFTNISFQNSPDAANINENHFFRTGRDKEKSVIINPNEKFFNEKNFENFKIEEEEQIESIDLNEIKEKSIEVKKESLKKNKSEGSYGSIINGKPINYKFKLAINKYDVTFNSGKDYLVDLYAKSVIHKKVKENYYERLKKLEYSHKPAINPKNSPYHKVGKSESKEDFYNRLTNSKKMLLNSSRTKNRNKSLQEFNFNTNQSKICLTEPKNLTSHKSPKMKRIQTNRSNLISTKDLNTDSQLETKSSREKVKIREIKQTNKLRESIKYQQNKEKEIILNTNNIINNNITKFIKNNLKEIFEIVYRNCANIDDLEKIEKYGVDISTKEKLVIPTFHIMKERSLDFNFQNFFLVANDIINYSIQKDNEI